MTKLQTKQAAFLDEMIEFYSKNDRSVIPAPNGGRMCVYHREGKHGCAIGRKVRDEIAIELDSIQGPVHNQAIFRMLPEWMRELDKPFLRHVQILHDAAENFDDSTHELTEKGLQVVDEIRERFGLQPTLSYPTGK